MTTEGVDPNTGHALAGTGNAETFKVVPATPAPTGGGGSGSTPGTAPGRERRPAPAPGTTSGRETRPSRGGDSRSVSGAEQLRRAARGRAPVNAGINTTEGVIRTPNGTSFAGSVTRSARSDIAERAGGSRSAGARGGSGKAGVRPSERSARADLWSGLAPGKNPSLMPEGGLATAEEGSGPGAALALILLAAGALALVGLGVAEVQRRRKAPTA